MNKPVKGRNVPEDAIQLVECDVATGPHQHTIVRRGWTRPVTYPEALLLEHLHQQPGKPEAVRNVKHAGYVQRSIRQEKRRLAAKYGANRVEAVFPGREPQMERFYPMDAPAPGTKCRAGDWVVDDPAPVEEEAPANPTAPDVVIDDPSES